MPQKFVKLKEMKICYISFKLWQGATQNYQADRKRPPGCTLATSDLIRSHIFSSVFVIMKESPTCVSCCSRHSVVCFSVSSCAVTQRGSRCRCRFSSERLTTAQSGLILSTRYTGTDHHQYS